MLVILAFYGSCFVYSECDFSIPVCVCACLCIESSVYQANHFYVATYLSTSPVYRWPSDGQSKGSTAGGMGKKEKWRDAGRRGG